MRTCKWDLSSPQSSSTPSSAIDSSRVIPPARAGNDASTSQGPLLQNVRKLARHQARRFLEPHDRQAAGHMYDLTYRCSLRSVPFLETVGISPSQIADGIPNTAISAINMAHHYAACCQQLENSGWTLDNVVARVRWTILRQYIWLLRLLS